MTSTLLVPQLGPTSIMRAINSLWYCGWSESCCIVRNLVYITVSLQRLFPWNQTCADQAVVALTKHRLFIKGQHCRQRLVPEGNDFGLHLLSRGSVLASFPQAKGGSYG